MLTVDSVVLLGTGVPAWVSTASISATGSTRMLRCTVMPLPCSGACERVAHRNNNTCIAHSCSREAVTSQCMHRVRGKEAQHMGQHIGSHGELVPASIAGAWGPQDTLHSP